MFSFLDQGPPESWRGPRGGDPDERFQVDEFSRGDFGPVSEVDGAPRGRGKSRGGRRGRGGRR